MTVNEVLAHLPFLAAAGAAFAAISIAVGVIRGIQAQLHAQKILYELARTDGSFGEALRKVAPSREMTIDEIEDLVTLIERAITSTSFSETERHYVEVGLRQSDRRAEERYIRRLLPV